MKKIKLINKNYLIIIVILFKWIKHIKTKYQLMTLIIIIIIKYLYLMIDIKYNLYNKLSYMNQYNQINNIIYMI